MSSQVPFTVYGCGWNNNNQTIFSSATASATERAKFITPINAHFLFQENSKPSCASSASSSPANAYNGYETSHSFQHHFSPLNLFSSGFSHTAFYCTKTRRVFTCGCNCSRECKDDSVVHDKIATLSSEPFDTLVSSDEQVTQVIASSHRTMILTSKGRVFARGHEAIVKSEPVSVSALKTMPENFITLLDHSNGKSGWTLQNTLVNDHLKFVLPITKIASGRPGSILISNEPVSIKVCSVDPSERRRMFIAVSNSEHAMTVGYFPSDAQISHVTIGDRIFFCDSLNRLYEMQGRPTGEFRGSGYEQQIAYKFASYTSVSKAETWQAARIGADLFNIDSSYDTKIAAIASEYTHLLILTTAGKVYGYGNSQWGQLCSKSSSSVPIEITLPKPIKQIGVGAVHSVVLSEDNTVYVFGDNEDGEIGLFGTVMQSHGSLYKEFALPSKLKVNMKRKEWICKKNTNQEDDNIGLQEVNMEVDFKPSHIVVGSYNTFFFISHENAVLKTRMFKLLQQRCNSRFCDIIISTQQ